MSSLEEELGNIAKWLGLSQLEVQAVIGLYLETDSFAETASEYCRERGWREPA